MMKFFFYNDLIASHNEQTSLDTSSAVQHLGRHLGLLYFFVLFNHVQLLVKVKPLEMAVIYDAAVDGQTV